jgi:transposase-like protein
MEQRKQFVLTATAEDANISELCRKYGISRKTGHKWINRANLGLPLCDQSRRPHRQPSKTANNIEEEIISLRLQHTSVSKKITAMRCGKLISKAIFSWAMVFAVTH